MKYKGRFGDHLMASSHRVLRERSHCRLAALRQGLAYLFIFQDASGALKFSRPHVMGTALVVRGTSALSSNCGCVLTCYAILGFSGDCVPWTNSNYYSSYL